QLVVISPMMWTRPVDTQVSQATRASVSWVRISSRMATEIWPQIVSGCPSVTDSDVKRCLAIDMPPMQTVKTLGTKRHPEPEGAECLTLIFRFPAGFGTLRLRAGCRASQGLSPQPLLISTVFILLQ